VEDGGRAQGGGDVSHVLMAGPQAEDGTAVLDGLRVAEPVAHDGGSDGSAGGLEEPEEEVDAQDEGVTEGLREIDKVEPEGDVDEEEAESGSEQADGEDGGGVDGVAQLSVDDVSGGVGCHEDGVHLGEDSGRESSMVLEFLLDGGVALAGEVGHEVPSEGDEECPWLVRLQTTEILSIILLGCGLKQRLLFVRSTCHDERFASCCG